jgi:anti-anti-sigma factor
MQTIPNDRIGHVLRATTVSPRRVMPVVVRAPHELDFLSGPRLVAMVERVVALPPVPDVHLLLDRLDFVDIAGVRALLACRDVARDHGAELYFVDVSFAVERILGLIPDRLQVTDLVQIVPAAARLEAMGGEAAHRIRAGVIELLVDTCDTATLSTARFRLLQRVGEQQDLRDAELRLMDEAIRMASTPAPLELVDLDDHRSIIPPAIGA